MTFQPGDKVRCIDNKGVSNFLTVGDTYTIQKLIILSDGQIQLGLVETTNVTPYSTRFVLDETGFGIL